MRSFSRSAASALARSKSLFSCKKEDEMGWGTRTRTAGFRIENKSDCECHIRLRKKLRGGHQKIHNCNCSVFSFFFTQHAHTHTHTHTHTPICSRLLSSEIREKTAIDRHGGRGCCRVAKQGASQRSPSTRRVQREIDRSAGIAPYINRICS